MEVHDGLIDLVVRSLGDATPPKRGRGRPPKTPRTVVAAGAGTAQRISPWDGVWRAVGWLPDGVWVAAIGESETRRGERFFRRGHRTNSHDLRIDTRDSP